MSLQRCLETSEWGPSTGHTMFSIFGDVKSLVKLDEICIDNNIFRLHYKVVTTTPTSLTVAQASVIVLVTASLLVTARQYIGDEGGP